MLKKSYRIDSNKLDPETNLHSNPAILGNVKCQNIATAQANAFPNTAQTTPQLVSPCPTDNFLVLISVGTIQLPHRKLQSSKLQQTFHIIQKMPRLHEYVQPL